MKQVVGKGKQKTLYTLNQTMATAVLVLLAGADMVMNPPNGFQMQISNRSKPWIQNR